MKTLKLTSIEFEMLKMALQITEDAGTKTLNTNPFLPNTKKEIKTHMQKAFKNNNLEYPYEEI